jgi:hypothetical protein
MRLSAEPAMMRMAENMNSVIRGPDGSLRPANDMVPRDRLLRGDGIMQPMEAINRAPSADGMGRQPIGLPPNTMRPGEIGRLGPDGAVMRGPYGQPPSYGSQGAAFGQSAPPYVLHQTPAQQHQNMQIQRAGGGAAGGVPRSGSVDDMPVLSAGMNLSDDLGDMVVMPGGPGRPNRQSMPPQMVNGNGPRQGPGPGMGPGPRRSMLVPPRPCALGLGVVRLLEMSQEMGTMKDVSTLAAHLRALTLGPENGRRLAQVPGRVLYALGQGVHDHLLQRRGPQIQYVTCLCSALGLTSCSRRARTHPPVLPHLF